METHAQSLEHDLREGLRDNAGWAVGIGVVMIIAGVLALISPLAAGLAITVLLGVMLLVGGIAQVVLAFRAGAFGRGLIIFLLGVLGIVAGAFMLSQPVAALASLTLLLAGYFLATGVLAVIAAFQLRHGEGWGWMLANGIITILLGWMIGAQWPLSGAWAAGVLIGVQLLVGGITLTALGTSIRRHVSGAA